MQLRLVDPKRTALSLLITFFALVVGALGCGDNISPASNKAAITGFSINGVAGQINGRNISVTLPAGTDKTNLAPTVTFTGDRVDPPSGEAQDFSSPVAYTVFADDGTRTVYSATVNVATNSAKALTAFSFEAAHNSGLTSDVVATINGTDITATVPFGTDVTALVATFTTTGTSVKVSSTAQVSGATANDFTSPVVYTVSAGDGSTQNYTVTLVVASDDAKAITAFSFEPANNAGLSATVTAAITGTSITATVPFGTNVSALKATFATTGTSVKVGSTMQVSGTTPNNFTTAVTYTVTAADASTQDYTVTVSIAPDSATGLGPFKFLSANNNPNLSVDVNATITGTQIKAIVPFGTDVTKLVATFSTTGATVKVGTTPQDSGITENDFTNPVTYTVVAADGTTTQDYIVTVDNSQASDKDIQKFTIDGVDGNISGTNITLTLPVTTNLTALIPTIIITGTSVDPDSGVAQDFTNPVTYTVTAADNTTKSYTVTVSLAGNSDKDITQFSINGFDAVIASTSATTGTITLNMPKGTSLTSLSPVIAYTGIKVSPDNGVPTDFTNPVDYVVTAQDGSTKTYTVNIGVVNGQGTKVISSFEINGVAGQISNGLSSGSITLVLPAGTDLTAQTPIIVINGSALSPPSRIPQNFTNPVIYTVTAADGSTRQYTVTVTTL